MTDKRVFPRAGLTPAVTTAEPRFGARTDAPRPLTTSADDPVARPPAGAAAAAGVPAPPCRKLTPTRLGSPKPTSPRPASPGPALPKLALAGSTMPSLASPRPTLPKFALAGALLSAVVLTGCSTPEAGPAGSKLRIYAVDMAGGAKVCEVPKVNLFAGSGSEVPMKLVNDGGWCGISMSQQGAKPFDAGLLTARPAHGTVLIHEVGDDTRIDYTPDRGFSGKDAFAVKLIPGNVAVQVTVAVAAPSA